MNIFIKLFWGFDPTDWPIVSFSLRGSLNALLTHSKPGDLMAFVGTKGSETAEYEQGRLLGLAEFGRKQLHARAALHPKVFAEAEKGPNGDIKWPYAVLMTRAWRFTEIPLPVAAAVLGRRLPMAAISSAVLLRPDEQRRVLALPREEIEVAVTQEARKQRDDIAAIVGPSGTMGPVPSSFTITVVRDALQEAYTYAFQFGKRNVWKVGWAHEPASRLGELNKHIPYEVLGEQWGGGFTQKWASEGQAYAMEQRVLGSFPSSVRYAERVHCTKDELETAWREAWKG